jgi:tellurite resistance protein
MIQPRSLSQPRFGLWRRTPPAVFPPIMGLFGLGLAWRLGAPAFGLPGGLAELLLGAVTLIYLFALLAYLAKVARRPGVVAEDLRVLPGRAGLAALSLSLMLLAATLVPYHSALGQGVAIVAFGLHATLALLAARAILTGPVEARVVTPVWHLLFVGFILGPLPGLQLGLTGPVMTILFAMIPVAAGIWAISLWQLVTRIPPAPLRPLLAIHLAPASLFAIVAAGLGMTTLAAAFAFLGTAILIALMARARWINAAGFSALWGAFTFPLAAYATALFSVFGGAGAGRLAAGIVLVAATLIIPPIALKVMQAWARGTLAATTNAAQA